MAIHPVWIQTIYYMVSWMILLLFLGFIQKGFFWKYLKVKMSFGKLILIKVRGLTRDFFCIGEIDKNFLIFKVHKENKRINVEDKSVFYRCLGPIWCDVDEQKNALCKVDYSTISGFDAVKYEDLYTRALYKPAITDNKEKIMLGLLVAIAIGIVIIGILVFKNAEGIQALWTKVGQVAQINKGIIVGSNI